MGIQGFETYLLSRHGQSCPRVKIESLVDKFRGENTAEAVAVIDTNFLIRQCLKSLDVVCGGQFKEYRDSLLKYVKRLTDIGISPVFFFDGANAPAKMRCWIRRKCEELKRIELIYEDVSMDYNTSNHIEPDTCSLPPGVYESTILTLRAANYPVIISQSDSDLEMARYAREHDCFAIMSRDTDFVVLNGARYYLSIFHKHFDASDMSTILFDRVAIAKDLGLRPEELPLLAALMKNDYVERGYLMPLYSKLLGRRSAALRPDAFYHLNDLVPHLARLVREDLAMQDDPVDAILSRTFGGYPPFLLRNLARELGLQNAYEMQEKLRAQLEESLAMHDFGGRSAQASPARQVVEDVEPDVLERALARQRGLALLNSAVLTLLLHRTISMGPALEDPRQPASRSTEGALRLFRRRIYGLLQVKGPFTEWVVPNRAPDDGQMIEPCVVEAITPDPGLHPHPGLLALWDDDDEPDVVADRWRLLAWALAAHRPASARVDVLAEKLRKLPRNLAVPTAIIYILYHSGALNDLARPADELVVLLTRTCLVARRATMDVLATLSVERFDRLAMHVSAIFMRTFGYVSILIDVLGAPVAYDQMHPELYFDGKIFHCMFAGEAPDHSSFDCLSQSLEDEMVHIVMREEEEEAVEE